MINIQNNEVTLFNNELFVKNIDYYEDRQVPSNKCSICSFRFNCLIDDFTHMSYRHLILGPCLFGHSYK